MATVTMSYQNAQMQVDVLRHELEKAGLMEDASRLIGIEVNCQDTAKAAIEIIEKMKLRNGGTSKDLHDSRNWTLERLQAVSQ